MPTVGYFDGIKVSMYDEKGKTKHKCKHVHVFYSGHECVISLEDLGILEGTLPTVQLRKVNIWLEKHLLELIKMWNTSNFYNLSK